MQHFCEFIKSKFESYKEKYPISLHKPLAVTQSFQKDQNQWVTIYDQELSNITMDATKQFFPQNAFVLSEEALPLNWNPHLNWNEGLKLLGMDIRKKNILIVVDPVDGTRELVKGIPECVYSVSCLEIEEQGAEIKPIFSWIWNFLTGEEFYTNDREYSQHIFSAKHPASSEPSGLVGHWEYEKIQAVYPQFPFSILAKGSIAYKLALLSEGKCDFVLSLRPKNIWDISAGLHLNFSQNILGIYLDSVNSPNSPILPTYIKNIDQWWWPGPMLWCNQNLNQKQIATLLDLLKRK